MSRGLRAMAGVADERRRGVTVADGSAAHHGSEPREQRLQAIDELDIAAERDL